MVSSTTQWAVFIQARFMKKGCFKLNYIKYSIWPGIKIHLSTVMENACWQIGNGKLIKFWSDRWMDSPIVEAASIPAILHSELQSKFSDFISTGEWCFPSSLVDILPNIVSEVSKVAIPKFQAKDHMVWKITDSGKSSLKEA